MPTDHHQPHITMLSERPLADYDARAQLTDPDAAAALVCPVLDGLDREHCLVVSLDTKHRLIAIDTLSIGTAEHTFMAPREVFRTVLLRGASAFMVAHNHPSGDPTLSADDRAITRRLKNAAEILGIDLLDHLVVGGASAWTSCTRKGLL